MSWVKSTLENEDVPEYLKVAIKATEDRARLIQLLETAKDRLTLSDKTESLVTKFSSPPKAPRNQRVNPKHGRNGWGQERKPMTPEAQAASEAALAAKRSYGTFSPKAKAKSTDDEESKGKGKKHGKQ